MYACIYDHSLGLLTSLSYRTNLASPWLTLIHSLPCSLLHLFASAAPSFSFHYVTVEKTTCREGMWLAPGEGPQVTVPDFHVSILTPAPSSTSNHYAFVPCPFLLRFLPVLMEFIALFLSFLPSLLAQFLWVNSATGVFFSTVHRLPLFLPVW